MNEKEIAEIRRRFRSDKSNISRIRGCYVNDKKEIVSEFNQSLGLMMEDEVDEILAILKKTLSGTLGKNLVDIEFSTQQVLEGEEHKLLMSLRDSSLEDDAAVTEFYNRIISSVDLEDNYLILLSCDKYDVFSYSADGKKEDDSSSVFTYILCSICPLKLTKPALSYRSHENSFCTTDSDSVVGAPELGFMFPCFDDRCANIYKALYYSKNTAESYDDFINAVFKSDIPMPAQTQRETFQSLLCDTVSDACSYDVVQSVHTQLCEMVEEHKSGNEKEPLTLSKKDVSCVLQSCGVDDEHIVRFEEKYDTDFGANTEVLPQNIVDTKQFEVRTADVTIKVKPECSDLVKTEIINGVKYILIRADENVEVNGVNIQIKQ